MGGEHSSVSFVYSRIARKATTSFVDYFPGKVERLPGWCLSCLGGMIWKEYGFFLTQR